MRLRERVISICLSVVMLLSVAPFQAKAAENTTPLIEVTVTETTETGATIHIKNNKDYGTNQIGFYKVLKKSEPGFDNAQELITSFGDITDSTTMMAASIPEFLAGPPTFTAQTEATKTVSDLEAGTEYVVYAAIGDYYAMAASNDYSGCSFAAMEFSTEAGATASLIEVTVTETTETGATIHIKNNKDYGTNQIGFYKVLKKSEPGFDNAQELITSFGDITDSTTMMAASIPEFLAGPPTFTAQTEATKTVSDLEAGTEYVVYAAIGDYYAMAASNDYSGCSFAAVEFTTKTAGGEGETPIPPDQENAVVEVSYQENGKDDITKVCFEKFEDATAALNTLSDCSDITLTLLKDTTIQPTKAYGYAAVIQKSCTLDLNGKVLTAYSDIVGSITGGLLVEGEVHFVLTDSSEEHSGMILSKAGSAAMITGLAIGSGFSDSVYEKLPGDITFEMNGTVVKDINYDQPKAVKGCLSISNSCVSAELNDSVVYGAVTTNCDSLELNNSRVEANTEGQRVLTFRGKLIMNESVIANTYDGSAESCTVSYYRGANENVDVGTILELTDSTISAVSGTALNLGMNQKVKYSVDLKEGAHILSNRGIGIYVDSQMVGPSWYDEENPTPHAVIHLYAGSVVSGTSAIEVAVGTKNYKLSDVTKVIRIEMDDGAFLGYDNVPALPNSSVMTYPTGMVLDVDTSNQVGFEEFYTLKNTSEMDQIIDTITFGYQNLATLNASIEGTRNLYIAGNADGTYDAILWNAFIEAYEAAIALIGTDETAANLNANQNEIDYREQQLSATALALRESLDTVDLSNLANGTYSIEIQMIHSRDDGSFSMANGAVGRTAVLTVKDDEQTLSVDFKPMALGPINGHLLKFWVYNAPTPNEAKLFDESYIQDDYVVHSNYYNQDGVNDPVYDANGTYPGRITFKLPYFKSTDGYNKIYGRVSVDAMASDQNVIMLLQYHTLKAITIQATLSIDADKISLLKAGTQSIGAKVTGDSGWTITATSDKSEVATAEYQDGKIIIRGVSAGDAVITVKAVKGEDELSRTIRVHVGTGTAGSAVTTETSGTANTKLDGDLITTNTTGGNITVSDKAVSVNASVSSDTVSKSTVTITDAFAGALEDALDALGVTSVLIETDVADITLDEDLIRQVAAENGDVILTVQKVSTANTPVGSPLAAIDVTLTASDGSKVEFKGGTMAIRVNTDAEGTDIVYAYSVEGGKLEERKRTSNSDGMIMWTTDHCSTWVLSKTYHRIEAEGGTAQPEEITGTWSVPIYVQNITTGGDSMANGAFAEYALAEVDDDSVKYTIGLQGMTLQGLYGHLERLWYVYDYPDDMTEADYTYYQDKNLDGEISKFPRTAAFTVDGAPSDSVYIYVSVDAMNSDQIGAGQQHALLLFNWDGAEKGSDAYDKAMGNLKGGSTAPDLTESTVASSESISSSNLDTYINEGGLTVENEDDSIYAVLDTAALEAIQKAAGSTKVKITLEKASRSDLNDAQKEAIGERPAFILTVTAGDEIISDFGDGVVEVSLPYELGEEENAGALVIWRVTEDGKLEFINCTYNEKTERVSFKTSRFAVYAIGYDEELLWTNPFTDVKEADWFYESVKYAAQKGLFAGTSETTFEPNTTMTRSMLVTVLYRLAGAPEVTDANKFANVESGKYYTDAVIWATQSGIVSGYGNGLFGTNDIVSREQLATILFRYAEGEGYDTTLIKDIGTFTDSGQVAGYAKRAMQWACANGIINGTSETTLSPKGSATRAQAAAILMRFDENIVIPAQEKTAAEAAKEDDED